MCGKETACSGPRERRVIISPSAAWRGRRQGLSRGRAGGAWEEGAGAKRLRVASSACFSLTAWCLKHGARLGELSTVQPAGGAGAAVLAPGTPGGRECAGAVAAVLSGCQAPPCIDPSAWATGQAAVARCGQAAPWRGPRVPLVPALSGAGGQRVADANGSRVRGGDQGERLTWLQWGQPQAEPGVLMRPIAGPQLSPATPCTGPLRGCDVGRWGLRLGPPAEPAGPRMLPICAGPHWYSQRAAEPAGAGLAARGGGGSSPQQAPGTAGLAPQPQRSGISSCCLPPYRAAILLGGSCVPGSPRLCLTLLPDGPRPRPQLSPGAGARPCPGGR